MFIDLPVRSIATNGLESARTRWELHWSSFLSDADIDFLANTAHCTSIRLPIGYFTLGPSFTPKTPFEGAPSQIYTSAWSAVMNLCARLHAHGIGTLLDLHALPGGANKDDHGGTSSGKAELWGNRTNLDLATRCLTFVAEEVRQGKVQGCVGIQLCNEAVWGANGMYGWYMEVARSIASIDTSVPLYISDAWDLSTALTWVAKTNATVPGVNPMIVDTHKYYTFSEEDRAQSPQQIISRIPNELGEVQAKCGNVVDNGAVQVIIGEWSCVLDGNTWGRSEGGDQNDLIQQFGKAQQSQWRQKSSGAFFWTAKMQWTDGGEWGFVEMAKKGVVLPPAELTLTFEDVKAKIAKAQQVRAEKKPRSMGSHVGYWNQEAPGGYFEHWRFEQGWDLGFSDALTFFGMRANGGVSGAQSGGDSIGALEVWIRKRLHESGHTGKFLWEWEHGFRQGVRDFSETVV